MPSPAPSPFFSVTSTSSKHVELPRINHHHQLQQQQLLEQQANSQHIRFVHKIRQYTGEHIIEPNTRPGSAGPIDTRRPQTENTTRHATLRPYTAKLTRPHDARKHKYEDGSTWTLLPSTLHPHSNKPHWFTNRLALVLESLHSSAVDFDRTGGHMIGTGHTWSRQKIEEVQARKHKKWTYLQTQRQKRNRTLQHGHTQHEDHQTDNNTHSNTYTEQEEQLYQTYREELLLYVQSPPCLLFVDASENITVEEEDLDALINAGGVHLVRSERGGDLQREFIHWLKRLNEQGVRVNDFAQLLIAVTAAKSSWSTPPQAQAQKQEPQEAKGEVTRPEELQPVPTAVETQADSTSLSYTHTPAEVLVPEAARVPDVESRPSTLSVTESVEDYDETPSKSRMRTDSVMLPTSPYIIPPEQTDTAVPQPQTHNDTTKQQVETETQKDQTATTAVITAKTHKEALSEASPPPVVAMIVTETAAPVTAAVEAPVHAPAPTTVPTEVATIVPAPVPAPAVAVAAVPPTAVVVPPSPRVLRAAVLDESHAARAPAVSAPEVEQHLRHNTFAAPNNQGIVNTAGSNSNKDSPKTARSNQTAAATATAQAAAVPAPVTGTATVVPPPAAAKTSAKPVSSSTTSTKSKSKHKLNLSSGGKLNVVALNEKLAALEQLRETDKEDPHQHMEFGDVSDVLL